MTLNLVQHRVESNVWDQVGRERDWDTERWLAAIAASWFIIAGLRRRSLAGLMFTIAGGILITGNLHGTPATNTALLAIGTLMASFVGTTGASIIMIRPVLRANDDRRFNVHVVVFFIFLVSNIGGSLTPLGDPPLFLGFLRGVSFFWTTTHLLPETLFAVALLLALFYALDSWFYRKEENYPPLKDPTPDRAIKLFGKVNILLLGGVILGFATRPQSYLAGEPVRKVDRRPSALAQIFHAKMAPSEAAASMAIRASGMFGTKPATRSPGPTPSAFSAWESRLTWS